MLSPSVSSTLRSVVLHRYNSPTEKKKKNDR
jgi:hypothetical protein